MSEPVLRALVVGGAVAGAVLAVLAADWWRRRRAERLVLDLSGIEARVILFSDEACPRCDRVRGMLDELDVDYTEIRHGGGRLGAIGVDSVPLVVARDEAGDVVAQIGGVPRKARLRRAVAGRR